MNIESITNQMFVNKVEPLINQERHCMIEWVSTYIVMFEW